MTVTEYPAYVAGQTLTADELNLLAEHSFHRDTLLGRLIGFGVNCGFSGTFTGAVLTIQPGMAVDQSGEPLVMRQSKTIAFPASPLSTTAYPFINSETDVWSVIARAADTELPHTACTETGCDGHSVKHLREVVLEVKRGRITGPRYAFSEHKVLKIAPLLLTPKGELIGNIEPFKTDLVGVLDELGGPVAALKGKVTAVTVGASEEAAIRGYKVGWLNMVLMAATDLVRCRALNAIECFRDDSHPGVVLGAVTQTGGTWTFTCSYKHHWEPPKGLSQALLGGTCQSVCGASQDFLVSVLTDYAPPVPAPTPTPPGGNGGVIIKPPIKYCPKGTFGCGKIVVFPPPKTRYPWPPVIKVPIGVGPDDYLPIDDSILDPDIRIIDAVAELYGYDKLNALNDGVFNADTLIGEHGVNVKATIENDVREHGGNPTVTVMTEKEFENALDKNQLDDFHPGTAFSGSDHVVVITNSKGLVTNMGVVPGMVAVRQAGPIAQVAKNAAVTAEETLTRVDGFQLEFNEGMKAVTGGFTNLQMAVTTLQADVGTIKGGPGDVGFAQQRITHLEERMGRADVLAERVAKLEGKALAEVGELGTKTYTVDVGNTLAEFAQTAVKALQTINDPRNKNLPEYIEAVERKQSELELAVRAGDPGIVAEATVNLLDSMRTMIGASGVEAGAKRALDAQFRAMKGLLG
ncbi:hypothetical protein [Demequina sp.]|uniref:hypothetical protein n=1 Tax=Demequina sp. TaxID=2050685 RepID=UPI003D1082AA